MAATTTPTALLVKQWSVKFFHEWLRENLFSRYTGTNEGAIIHVKQDLTAKKGATLNFPLVNKLRGDGVSGSGVLEGNEEAMASDGDDVKVSYRRNAVIRSLEDEQSGIIDYLNAARYANKNWLMDITKDMIITALLAPGNDPYVATSNNINYAGGAASEATKDAWATANDDRVLFGSAKGNSSGDHSADLAKIDNTADKLTAGVVSLAKRMAKTADPAITPYRAKEDEEWYVMFCNSLAFRDLKNDTTMAQANREAWTRGKSNPLFKDGDLIYDGVICREIPEIPTLSGVGASGIDVAPNFLCGAGAIGVAIAKRATPIMEDKDYKFSKGVGIMQSFGIKKMMMDNPLSPGDEVQHGVVTVYTAGVADA